MGGVGGVERCQLDAGRNVTETHFDQHFTKRLTPLLTHNMLVKV